MTRTSEGVRNLLRLGVVVFAAMVARPEVSRAGDCGEEEDHVPPSAGHYKGSFRLDYQLQFPGLPPGMKPTITSSGDFEFDLGRTELDEAPSPPPPPSPSLRSPLRPVAAAPAPTPSDRAAPGQFSSNAEQVAAYWAAEEERQKRNEELAERRLQELAAKLPPSHMYVAKDQKPRINGEAFGRIAMKIAGVLGPGATGESRGQSAEPNHFVLTAEEESPETGFDKIEVKGRRGETGFEGTARVTTRQGSGTSRIASSRDKSADEGPILLMNLAVESTDCASMKGSVDPTPIREMFPTAPMTVLSSEWKATLDERDPEFEKKVDAIEAEPIPEEMDWATIDRFATEAAAVRNQAAPLTNYKRCVLKKLERKFVRIHLRALRTLARNFPKASDGASAVVMRTALERIQPIVKVLQLYGAGECSEALEAEATANEEVQALLKSILERTHTFEELMPFLVFQALGRLGELSDPFQMTVDAWVAGSLATPK